MRKPQVHQIQEQILRIDKNIGKVKSRGDKYQTSTPDISDGGLDGSLRWRRLYFVDDRGLAFTPNESIRDFLINYVEAKSAETPFLRGVILEDISAIDIISSRDVIKTDSIINESSLPRGAHVIYMTKVRTINPTTLPMKWIANTVFGLTPISCKIDMIHMDGDTPISQTMYTSGSGLVGDLSISINLPENTEVILLFYFYQGIDTSESALAGQFKLDTKILGLTMYNLIPSPFKPENLIASNDRIASILLDWTYEPFLSNSDFIKVFRGFMNESTNQVENWTTIATLNGYTLNFLDYGVQNGQRYFYKIQYVSSDGDESPFSNIAEGMAVAPPLTATVELLPNSQTFLEGYYNSLVSVRITCSEITERPMVIHVDSVGGNFAQEDLTTIDGGKTWVGDFTFVEALSDAGINFFQGKAIIRVYVPSAGVAGVQGDPTGANTGLGLFLTSAYYIYDNVPPVLSGIGISKDNDRAEDSYSGSAQVFVFPYEAYDDDRTTPTQLDPESSPFFPVFAKFTSGLYQIQFSNNGSDISSFSDWQDYRSNGSYTWILDGTLAVGIVYARVRDRAGNTSTIVSDTIRLLLLYPDMPEISLMASGGIGRITLGWTSPSDTSLAGYSVYKRTYPLDPRVSTAFYDDVADIGISSYTDVNVVAEVQYSYALKVYDQFLIESTGWSSMASATPSGIIPPVIDSGVSNWFYSPTKTIIQDQMVSGNLAALAFGGPASPWLVISGPVSNINLSEYYIDSLMLSPTITVNDKNSVRIEPIILDSSVIYWTPSELDVIAPSSLIVWNHPDDLAGYSEEAEVFKWISRDIDNHYATGGTAGSNTTFRKYGNMVNFQSTSVAIYTYPTFTGVGTGGYIVSMAVHPSSNMGLGSYAFLSLDEEYHNDITAQWGHYETGKLVLYDISGNTCLGDWPLNNPQQGSGTTCIYTFVWNYNGTPTPSSYIYISGALYASGTYNTVSGHIGKYLRLGCSLYGFGHFPGRIGEFIIARYTGGLADIQKMDGYMHNHWGIQADLPVGHPYRETQPLASITYYPANCSGYAFLTAQDFGDGTRGIWCQGKLNYSHWGPDYVNRSIVGVFGTTRLSSIW